MEKQIKNFRDFYTANIIEVCEGSGQEDDPKRIVYYVYSKKGHKIGIIDPINKLSN